MGNARIIAPFAEADKQANGYEYLYLTENDVNRRGRGGRRVAQRGPILILGRYLLRGRTSRRRTAGA